MSITVCKFFRVYSKLRRARKQAQRVVDAETSETRLSAGTGKEKGHGGRWLVLLRPRHPCRHNGRNLAPAMSLMTCCRCRCREPFDRLSHPVCHCHCRPPTENFRRATMRNDARTQVAGAGRPVRRFRHVSRPAAALVDGDACCSHLCRELIHVGRRSGPSKRP